MILVDEPRSYGHAPLIRGRQVRWCHMVTDGDSFDELHEFAERIGLRRAWFQGDHYDLTESRRAAAVRAGAVEVRARELVQRRLRRDANR